MNEQADLERVLRGTALAGREVTVVPIPQSDDVARRGAAPREAHDAADRCRVMGSRTVRFTDEPAADYIDWQVQSMVVRADIAAGRARPGPVLVPRPLARSPSRPPCRSCRRSACGRPSRTWITGAPHRRNGHEALIAQGWVQRYGAELVANWGTMLRFDVALRQSDLEDAWALSNALLMLAGSIHDCRRHVALDLLNNDHWFLHDRP